MLNQGKYNLILFSLVKFTLEWIGVVSRDIENMMVVRVAVVYVGVCLYRYADPYV